MRKETDRLTAKEEVVKRVQESLFALQDKEYKEFHAKLIPNVDRELIVGVRTPALRAFAKEYGKEAEAELFLTCLPHVYYEENNLHAFLIEQCKDYTRVLGLLEEFLPYVDNWATCDMMRPKCFKKHTGELAPVLLKWMDSELPYTIRFGIEMLMTFYLDGEFKDEYAEAVCKVESDEYYVNMMRAWYFATALAKQWEAVIPYLKERKLDEWTHRKTIQKAVESYRITSEQKEYLRSLR